MRRSLLVVPFLVTACGAAVASTNSPFEALKRESQLFVVDAGGRDVVRLTRDDESHHAPAWSPDGRLAFLSSRGGSFALEVGRPDGSDRRVLLGDAVLSVDGLAWSPDGRRLAFTTFSERGSLQRIETATADGARRMRVAE